LQVHTHHINCSGSPAGTCICAVTVREGNDVLSIQACVRPLHMIRYLRDQNIPEGKADIKELSSIQYKVGDFCLKNRIYLALSCLLSVLFPTSGRVLFCSSAVLDLRIGHIINVLLHLSLICHSD